MNKIFNYILFGVIITLSIFALITKNYEMLAYGLGFGLVGFCIDIYRNHKRKKMESEIK